MFSDLEPVDNIFIGGVRGTKTCVNSQGTVKLIANHSTGTCTIKLRNALYVLLCKHKLISLRRWEELGQSYHTKDNILTLYLSKEVSIIKGEHSYNNLYWIKLKLVTHIDEGKEHVFNATAQMWETWHQRYGHIGYQGLKKLRDNSLVTGFMTKERFQMIDCIPCIELKMMHKPFPLTATQMTDIGDLTHIDLWGKYSINLIKGNQYYILFVDDYSRYVTVQFLKTKTVAIQSIHDYLTHLSTYDHMPKAVFSIPHKPRVAFELRKPYDSLAHHVSG